MSKKYEKPPLGLRPRWIVEGDRLQEVLEAMSRYISAMKEIPVEWLEEYNDIVERNGEMFLRLAKDAETTTGPSL